MLAADVPTPPAIVRTADSFDLATSTRDPEITGTPQHSASTDTRPAPSQPHATAHLDLGLAPGHCPIGQPGEVVNCGGDPEKGPGDAPSGSRHTKAQGATGPSLPGGVRLRVRTENKIFPTGQVGQGALGGLELPF